MSFWSALFGSASGAATVGGSASSAVGGSLFHINQEWQYAIRYDKNVSNFRHGNVYDDDDLEDGIFTLPHESIAWVGIYYSRFLESEFMGTTTKDHDEIERIGFDSKGTTSIDVSARTSLTRLTDLFTRWHGGAERRDSDDSSTSLQDFLKSTKSSDMAADAVLLLEGAKLSYNTLRDLSLFSHHYIVVETTNGMFYSFDKYCDYIDIRRDLNKTAITHTQPGFESTRKHVRFAEKMGWVQPHKPMKLSELLPFLRFHMHEPYHLLWSNCQKFTKDLWESIVVPPNKRGKQKRLRH